MNRTGTLRTRRRTGFTLIELIVVIIILAILAAVVIPNVVHRTDDARISSAMTTLKSLDDSLEMMKADTGVYPTADQGLAALISNSFNIPKWNGPYLKNQTTVPKDPWGHDYIYKQPGADGRDYDLISAGPDGQPGTGDDLEAANLQKQSK